MLRVQKAAKTRKIAVARRWTGGRGYDTERDGVESELSGDGWERDVHCRAHKRSDHALSAGWSG
ncbi:hypothetical protein Memar_1270 [Methanoculleus marisnigri JR1]|uniref:Uncharacterized protein n=1 Tax=Methanoculleus marisnigri (strain ATCC 35101 / DSM 1498 / JR1) TaxID=368407 RepID=A3CV00_METMJ|nr:hypothetical protein Memar_1270 [Methanoculleus marisnigri JR1]